MGQSMSEKRLCTNCGALLSASTRHGCTVEVGATSTCIACDSDLIFNGKLWHAPLGRDSRCAAKAYEGAHSVGTVYPPHWIASR